MRKRAIKAGRKTPHELSGGPWDGQILRLETPGTLPIVVQGQRGRYNASGKWVPSA